MKPATYLALSLGMVLPILGPADLPAGEDSPRGVKVEEVRNDSSPFFVRVDVLDHPDRVFQDGETMTAEVVSEKDGHLYLMYRDADGRQPGTIGGSEL